VFDYFYDFKDDTGAVFAAISYVLFFLIIVSCLRLVKGQQLLMQKPVFTRFPIHVGRYTSDFLAVTSPQGYLNTLGASLISSSHIFHWLVSILPLCLFFRDILLLFPVRNIRPDGGNCNIFRNTGTINNHSILTWKPILYSRHWPWKLKDKIYGYASW